MRYLVEAELIDATAFFIIGDLNIISTCISFTISLTLTNNVRLGR